MSEREELAKIMSDAWDSPTDCDPFEEAADAVLAHLRAKGWRPEGGDQAWRSCGHISWGTCATCYVERGQKLSQAERERDALQAECQRLKGTTMLGVPISDADRDAISKDGP